MGVDSPLALAPMGPEYAPAWLRWRQEAAMIRYNPLEQADLAALAGRLAATGHDVRDEFCTEFRWVVLLAGDPIGTVGLKVESWRMGTGDLGWGIGAAWHRQGLGTRAVALLCEEVFAKSRLRRLVGYIHPENIASRRLAARLGFVEEGLLREHVILNGAPADQVVAGLLKKDWLAGPGRRYLS